MLMTPPLIQIVSAGVQVVEILGREAERTRHRVNSPTDEAELIGVVDSTEPKWIQKMRAELRLMHCAMSTETAYIG